LKAYIANLEKSSLWGGTLDLKNLTLREDALNELCGLHSFNLRLSSSFIDRVSIEVPIIDFYSRPHIHVRANSLYATLGPASAG